MQVERLGSLIWSSSDSWLIPVISYFESANLPSRDLASPSLSLCPFSANHCSEKGRGQTFWQHGSLCLSASFKVRTVWPIFTKLGTIISLQDVCLLFCTDMKSDLSHWGNNIGWRCWRRGRRGRYLWQSKKKQQEAGNYSIMRSLMRWLHVQRLGENNFWGFGGKT